MILGTISELATDKLRPERGRHSSTCRPKGILKQSPVCHRDIDVLRGNGDRTAKGYGVHNDATYIIQMEINSIRSWRLYQIFIQQVFIDRMPWPGQPLLSKYFLIGYPGQDSLGFPDFY